MIVICDQSSPESLVQSTAQVGRKQSPIKDLRPKNKDPPQNHVKISRNVYLNLRCVRNNNIFNYTKFSPGSSFST